MLSNRKPTTTQFVSKVVLMLWKSEKEHKSEAARLESPSEASLVSRMVVFSLELQAIAAVSEHRQGREDSDGGI
ncbi:unnamed protein product [Caenorhabditis sp. 36 PRJEB53466]|nr:unnamed protein product [Caenorhabditis sp. 36 PRJEB53466]